ncbi:MAG: hypothetical protein H0T71_06030 [Acidobacteria bacterium]|nr:hypothetical protein [Acidobacteriota bacterium]
MTAAANDDELSGVWTLSTTIESSSMRTFQGLQLGYRIELNQNGNQISGSGQKVTENGRAVAAGGRTPISVRGTVEGNRLTLTFTERGARRPTEGKFILHRQDGGALRGRFSSSAAGSSGLAEARKHQG